MSNDLLADIYYYCYYYFLLKCLHLEIQSYRVTDECLTAAALVLLLLAADVVEGEQQVMSLCQMCRKSQLHFFIEVWGPGT